MKKWLALTLSTVMLAAGLVVAYTAHRAEAATFYTVSGTVTNQAGAGVYNVAVTATNVGDSTVQFGPVTTAKDGSYSMSVRSGSYDFHFTSSDTGYAPIIKSNVTVSTNQTISVQLAPAITQHTLSGVITDANGNPVPGLQVWLDNTLQFITDANGHYSATAAAKSYPVSIRKDDSAVLPAYPFFWLNEGSVDLTNSDQTANYTLPGLQHVSVSVVDSHGNPVAAQGVYLQDGVSLTETANATTDRSGVVVLPVLHGVPIPAHAICTVFTSPAATVCSDTAFDGNSDQNVTIVGPAFNTASGTITDSTGNPVAGVAIVFRSTSGNNGRVSTDSNGQYSVNLLPDTYHFVVEKDDSGILPGYPYFDVDGGTVDLTSANTTDNVQLPGLINITVTILDAQGNPVTTGAGVSYAVGERFQPGFETNTAGATHGGVATIRAFAGIPLPAGSLCTTIAGTNVCNTASIPATGDISVTLQAPVTHVFSGTVTDAQGKPVVGIRVESNGIGAVTDKTGHFSVTLVAGSYDVLLHNDNTIPGMPYFRIPEGSVDLTSGDITHDYQLPQLATLTVSVYDLSGAPMPGRPVIIDIASQENYNSTSTNRSGLATLPVFVGTTIKAGVLCVNFTDVTRVCNNTDLNITGDTSIVFQQSNAQTKPDAPTGVSALSLTNTDPVITWNAVSGVDHYIIYRDDAQLGTTSTTQFTDTSAADGHHNYYVVAVNASGLSSNPSNVIDVLVDKIAPTVSPFTVPNKTVSQTVTFNVTTTDDQSGVVAGEYYIGTDPGAGKGTAMTLTGDTLTGTLGANLPAGVYTIYVRAKDAAGNWSTAQSAQVVVTSNVSKVTGQGNFMPSTSDGDVLPNMSGFLNTANYNTNISYGATGITGSTFSFTYTSGGVLCRVFPGLPGCHTFTVTLNSVGSLTFSGTNQSVATIVGTASVTVDGVTTANTVKLQLTDGNRIGGGNKDQLTLYVYAQGADASSTPLYQVFRSLNRAGLTIN